MLSVPLFRLNQILQFDGSWLQALPNHFLCRELLDILCLFLEIDDLISSNLNENSRFSNLLPGLGFITVVKIDYKY